MSVAVLGGVFQHLDGTLSSPAKAHSHLFRAGEPPCRSPRTFLLYHCQARSAEFFHYPFSVVFHPPFFLPKTCAPLPAWPDPISPQDSTVSVPPGPQAPTTHLPPVSTAPYTYHGQIGAETPSQPACRPSGTHTSCTAQAKAQTGLCSEDRGQEFAAASPLHPMRAPVSF